MTPNEQRRANIATRRQIRAEMKQRGFTFAEQRFLERMIEGMPWPEAAKASGVPKWKAGHLVMMPEFRAELFRRMTAVRAAEGPRSLALALKLRDDGFKEDASAAEKRVALEAVRHLEGTDARQGVTVNVGVRIGPGLIVDLSDDEPEPNRTIDLTANRVAAPLPAHLAGRVDLGEDKPDDVAPALPTFVAVPTRPADPFVEDGGFQARFNVSSDTALKPVRSKPFKIPRRG